MTPKRSSASRRPLTIIEYIGSEFSIISYETSVSWIRIVIGLLRLDCRNRCPCPRIQHGSELVDGLFRFFSE